MLMKQLSRNKLVKNFWEGKTSLAEDEFLKSQKHIGEPEKAYFNFLNAKDQIPKNLEVDIWKSINRKHSTTKKLVIRWAVAATVVSVIGLAGIIGLQQRKAKLNEQFALIEQTLNHVSYELTTTHSSDIIYKDDNIVIVAEN